MRRLVAFVLLLSTIAFQTEAVFGEARDGVVHHEDVAEAFVHAHDPHSSRAHAAGVESEHGSSRLQAAASERPESGSVSDHCTHLHGVALVSPTDVTFDFRECSYALPPAPLPTDARFEALTPPPRS